jgi:hypothetical protein
MLRSSNEEYSCGNNGRGVVPAWGVLCIVVGAIALAALLKVCLQVRQARRERREVHNEAGKSADHYLGRRRRLYLSSIRYYSYSDTMIIPPQTLSLVTTDRRKQMISRELIATVSAYTTTHI